MPGRPQRRCILTGVRADPDALLRFAVDAAGVVVPDPARVLPGRGLWLAPAPGAVELARSKGAFARGAKRKVRVPEDLAARSVEAWSAHVAEQVARARRAGLWQDGPMSQQTPLTRRVAADMALLARLTSQG
ncbi:MAG TPA: DUF448 domain-containing protein [Ferrovibrio sp.]|jgi:predicted RNA-binding protein YlxR (DUF448 family)|uniref:DUF448 domain-containing protein n=1 Tax=Ferrovibrio sp. TaxID=1917215 RepID=UPI002B4AB9DC|nr:DUF448 domain-containing protein [Ferrovibrio sp.]HLT77497.1 DUF448 domain-containing protein [Ferrovibrio sp.]